jgi:hypothetical protein
MKNIPSKSNRLCLSLSLAIASAFVANVVKAEFQPPARDIKVDELSQKIARLIDLDLDRQILLTSALDRAIVAKETGAATAESVAPASQQPKTPPQKRLDACEADAYADVKERSANSNPVSPTSPATPAPRIRRVFMGARG